MHVNLTDKTVLVVGAGDPLGAEIARTLAAYGARIASADPTADPDTAQQAVDAAIAALGRLDSLVTPLPEPHAGRLAEMAPDDWQAALDEGLRSAFVFCRAVARPMMKQRSGRIILLASSVGMIGCTGQAAFAAASGGIFGLTRTAARELAGRGVTVNCVAVGLLEQPATAALPKDVLDKHLTLVPLARLGTPADVANTVAFLASDAASYITGQVIAVDGGMVMG